MKNELERIARLIRAKLEQVDFADGLNRMAALKHFPRGCCQTAANVYLYYLLKRKIVDAGKLFMLANAEITKNISHAWSRVGEFHVDLTADQFGREKIVITDFNPWPGIYRDPTEDPFTVQEFNQEYLEDLERMLTHIEAGTLEEAK